MFAPRISTPACEAARVLVAVQLDGYESAVRGVCALTWLLAPALPKPAGSVARAWGDVTRDVAAVQLSTTRWVLDV